MSVYSLAPFEWHLPEGKDFSLPCFPGGSEVKASACNVVETWVQSLGQEDPLEKEMTTHSSILAWRIPWTEEPGGLVHRLADSNTTE